MKRPTPSASSQWQALAPVALLLLGAAYVCAYLRLQSRWWFEDDPSLFAYADEIRNPASIFYDPTVLRHFTTGKAFVPMQLVSYWLDTRMAKLSAAFAYTHQACSFLLTLSVLYLVLLRLLRNDKVAAVSVSLLWMLTPSTSVVLQFLATRHYLEGLLFAGSCVLVLEGTASPSKKRNAYAYGFAFFCGVIAVLYKEIYAVIVPAVVLAYARKYRSRGLALGAAAMGIVYAGYRYWMLGAALDYNMAYLSAPQYLKFLTKLPYTFSSNYGGYVLWGILVTLCTYSVRTPPSDEKRREPFALYVATLVVLCLIAIVPVSYALYGGIRQPGTWYRIVFLLNTILLSAGGFLAVRYLTRQVQLIVFALALVFLGVGSLKTQKLWASMTASAEREGKFYLSNPDKVLLSEQAASWYIPGIDWMYGIKTPHYVLLKDWQTAQITSLVWRYQNGQFVPIKPAAERGGGSR